MLGAGQGSAPLPNWLGSTTPAWLQASGLQRAFTKAPRFWAFSEWIVSSPRALRDAANAPKWSMHFQMSSPELRKDLHAVIQSVRQSFDL
eukprot:15474186-Alexandrium_andersonii.AAC.1